MYDDIWKFYEGLSLISLAVRYCVNSLLFLRCTKSFFREKYGKKQTFVIWNVLYLTEEFALYYAFYTTDVFQNIMSVAIDISFLLLLQKLLFECGGAMNLFTVFSFSVGRNLSASIMSVAAYQLLGDFLSDCIIKLTENSEELLTEYGDIIFFISFAVTTIAAITGYSLILALYLKIVRTNFRKKDRRLQLKECLFLILPLVTSLCISITVRMMEFDRNGNEYTDIFNEIPVTKLFIPIVDILLLGTNAVSVILFQNLAEYNEEKNKRSLLESQICQMQNEIREIQDIYSDIRGLRHDIKNHIADISAYVKSVLGKDDPNVEGYIGKMTETVDRMDFSFNTGNPITDIIVHQKSQEAEKNGISFVSDFTFPLKDGIDVYDVGIILNNALENALEACENEERPYIFLRSYIKGSLFFIETENNFSGEIELSQENGLPVTKKKNPFSHGFGLPNIERTAKKYKGDIDIAVEEKNGKNVFMLTVMLHM